MQAVVQDRNLEVRFDRADVLYVSLGVLVFVVFAFFVGLYAALAVAGFAAAGAVVFGIEQALNR